MKSDMTIARGPSAKLEIYTPTVCNPGVAVESEPGGVSRGEREIRKSDCYVIVVAVLQHYVR